MAVKARSPTRGFALACALYITSIAGARASYVQEIPECPNPCGDNPRDLCPDTKILPPGKSAMVEFHEGLKEHDFWEIRIDQADKHTVKDTLFSVMIFDKENYEKFAAGADDYRACTEHKELNKPVSCMSLTGDFCRIGRSRVDKKDKLFHNYTHVVIKCENTDVQCPLEWHVGVVMMKKTKCYSLGMPCSVTTAFIWLFILGGLGVAMFVNRSKIADALATAGMPDISSVKWRFFSGRFSNGVEEMEARLAQSSTSGGGGDTAEPYARF